VPPDSFEEIVGENYADCRLDVYLADRIEDASRSFVQKLIKEGRVTLDGEVVTKNRRTVAPGQRVVVELPPPPSTELVPEDIPLDILYQDEHIVIVNKPAGMVVHPGTGNWSGTLVHALLYHCKDLQPSGLDPTRPGIVHRIDKDTSGVLMVAKTPRAFAGLADQVRRRDFHRRYLALVRGEFPENSGKIDAAIGRSLSDPAKMSVTGIRGREAVTYFRVLERFGVASLLALELETGRTHQIRVHLRFTGHPILGDPNYGTTDFADWPVPDETRQALEALPGQALHAEQLGLTHPVTGEYMEFAAPPPPEFQRALDALRLHAGHV
jgi:23S rRNA pseudouridine1911/1915/1917 synthase